MKFSPVRTELPYVADATVLFRPLAALAWSQWLDSAGRGRYDILVAEPAVTLVTRGSETEICRGSHCERSGDDPFALLRRELHRYQIDGPILMPFGGGAVGYFGYDLARRFEQLPVLASNDRHLPEMAVGIYQWAVVLDHHERRCWHIGVEGSLERWQVLHSTQSQPGKFHLQESPQSNMAWPHYAAAFAQIQRYLQDGDCYQVNLAQRFCARAEGDGFALYQALRQANPAPYAAYLNFPFASVLSASPERFLHLRERQVETRPIKGTRARLADAVEDRAQAQALHASAKDRAENLMIVDLLRNDLGRSCVPGSVQVPQLFQVESFATVHHLVSMVTGTLAAERDALDLLRGCFPGGSITGAPKRRAMEIIEELEPHRRGIYCGAIGYIGFDGAMDTNIAIRTLVYSDGMVCLAAGGGIVTDSTAEAEYRESLDKAAVMLQVLEQHRLPRG